MNEVDAFLEHHGVKGQKWGVRHNPTSAPRSTNKAAAKDAKEFARAKLFFGEGAGTRRKLIKATVDAKKKKDPVYAKAFDAHFANQDLSTHASKARAERSRKDKTKTVKQTAGAIARSKTGEAGTKAAFTTLAIGGVAYFNSPHGRRTLNNTVNKVSKFAGSAKSEAARRKGAAHVSKLLKTMGQ